METKKAPKPQKKTVKAEKLAQKTEQKQEDKKGQLLAAVLIRGTIGARGDIKDTIKMLNIHRKNYCAVFPDTPQHRGMMMKAKDYIAYGEISEETYKLLEQKRGENKSFFRLQPPRGGFERRGVKQPYTKKGALGYRGEKMNDLLLRMI